MAQQVFMIAVMAGVMTLSFARTTHHPLKRKNMEKDNANDRILLSDLPDFHDLFPVHDRQSYFQPEMEAGDIVDLCFFCDEACENGIKDFYSIPLDDYDLDYAEIYFEVVAEMTTEILRTLDPEMTARVHIVAEPHSTVPMTLYTHLSGDAAIQDAMDHFWGLTALWQTARAAGCDAGFIMVERHDELFSNSVIEGIADMFEMCTDHSYGLLKLSYYVDTMSEYLSHELGHLFGLYHDGPVNEAYSDPIWEEYFPVEMAAIQLQCTERTARHHIMFSVPMNSIHNFTSCSLAYFLMWQALARFEGFANSEDYDTSCVLADGSYEPATLFGDGIQDDSTLDEDSDIYGYPYYAYVDVDSDGAATEEETYPYYVHVPVDRKQTAPGESKNQNAIPVDMRNKKAEPKVKHLKNANPDTRNPKVEHIKAMMRNMKKANV